MTSSFRRTLLQASLLATSLFAGAVYAQAPIVIKFSHVVAADTPKGKASEYFAKKAAELTKGKVKVEVYANSALYKDKEEMEALQIGAVQMLAPSLAKFGPLGVKEFEAFDLPFIFDDRDDLHKITQGPVGASLLAKLEPKGIKGLAYWDNGFKAFSANTPLKTPADFKGKKFRIQSSKVLPEVSETVLVVSIKDREQEVRERSPERCEANETGHETGHLLRQPDLRERNNQSLEGGRRAEDLYTPPRTAPGTEESHGARAPRYRLRGRNPADIYKETG